MLDSSSPINELNDNKMAKIDPLRIRYPFCVVWTPIPFLTWLFPFIGHTGIGLSNGVIRDFAAPYYVACDDMAFGKPTKYWRLDLNKVDGGDQVYDEAIQKASDVYVGRMHNLICDNCHSHVSLCLNTMKYDGKTNWNMFKIAISLLLHSRYISWFAVAKTYLPFLSILLTFVLFIIFLN